MNTVAPADRPPSTLKRDLIWLIALVLAFLAGYLFALIQRQTLVPPAPPNCPQPTATTPSPGAAGGGAATPGAGTPADAAGSSAHASGAGDGRISGSGGSATGGGGEGQRKGSGSGGDGEPLAGGDVSASGNLTVSGSDSAAGSASGDADSGGGGKGAPLLSGDAPLAGTDAPAMAAGAKPPPPPESAGGDGDLGADMPDMKLAPDQPGSRMVGARDFRYDRSGLPHYPNVDKVASAMTIPPGGAVADGNATFVEIVTSDDPDAVAAWYRAHLPQDQWQMQAPPSAADVDQGIQQSDKSATNFDNLAKDLQQTQQPGGGGQAAAMEIMMKGMMAGQHSGPNGEASLKGTPIEAMFGKLANMQLRGAQEGLNRARDAHLTFFKPTDEAHDPRSIMILRDPKTGKTAVVISKKATQG